MWSVYSIQNGNQMWVFVFKRFATYRYWTYQLLLRSTEAKLTLNLHLYFQVCRNTYKRWSDVRKCPICWELGNELCYVANRLRCQTFRGRENVFDSVWCFVVIRMATLQMLCSGCVAQSVERSLPIPEVRGSNPVISKNLFIHWTFVYCQLCIEKTKIKEKRPGMAHFLKKQWFYLCRRGLGRRGWMGVGRRRRRRWWTRRRNYSRQKVFGANTTASANAICERKDERKCSKVKFIPRYGPCW